MTSRRNELWGALAAMLVALPSAIGFGVVVFASIDPSWAARGALYGALGAAVIGIVAPLAGGTAAMISAPCAPASAVLAGVATALLASGTAPERIPALLAFTAMLAAVLQFGYGLLRGGSFIKFLPYPVVSGFLSSVSLLIVLGQLPRALGLPRGISLASGLVSPEVWQWPGVAVALTTIAVTLLAPRLLRRVPAVILGLAAGIACYQALGLVRPELLVIDANPLLIGKVTVDGSFYDTIHRQLASLVTLTAADVQRVAYAALALSALLSIDTLKTSVMLDALTHSRHDSNRELRGQGLANFLAAAAGGMAGAGSSGPSMVNVSGGGTTRWSGVGEGLLVIAAIVLFGALFAWVPIAALAGILLVVAIRMFDWSAFQLLRHRETRLDFAVIAAVIVAAVALNLIVATATGVTLAILLFIRSQMHGAVLRHRATLREVSSKTRRLAAERDLLQHHGDAAAVVDLQGDLFFGTTDRLYTDLEPDLRTRQWLLLDLRRVQSLDYTGAHLFQQMHDRLAARGGGLLFCGMPSSLPHRQDIVRYLARLGVVGPRIFETRDSALEWLEHRILAAAGWHASETEQPLSLRDIELFAGLDDETIAAMQGCASERSLHAGDALFRRGDTGDELFLVRSGAVQILLPLPGGQQHHLATFGRGDFVGEMSFLDDEPRSADCYAKMDTELFVLSRRRFDALVRGDARVGTLVFSRLASAVSARLRQVDVELRALQDR